MVAEQYVSGTEAINSTEAATGKTDRRRRQGCILSLRLIAECDYTT